MAFLNSKSVSIRGVEHSFCGSVKAHWAFPFSELGTWFSSKILMLIVISWGNPAKRAQMNLCSLDDWGGYWVRCILSRIIRIRGAVLGGRSATLFCSLATSRLLPFAPIGAKDNFFAAGFTSGAFGMELLGLRRQKPQLRYGRRCDASATLQQGTHSEPTALGFLRALTKF